MNQKRTYQITILSTYSGVTNKIKTIEADDIEIDENSITFTIGADIVYICPARLSIVELMPIELSEPGEGTEPIN